MSHDSDTNGNHNSNGKGFQPKPRQREQQPTPSQSDDYMGQVMAQADSAIAGLEQAQQHNSAAAIERHAETLKLRTQDVQDTLTILLDPDLPIALAEIRATQEISNRLGKRNYARRTALPKVQIDIPEVPDFSRFYSQPGQSDHLLAESTSGSSPEPAIAP